MKFSLEMRGFPPVIFEKIHQKLIEYEKHRNGKTSREEIRISPNKKSTNLIGMRSHIQEKRNIKK